MMTNDNLTEVKLVALQEEVACIREAERAERKAEEDK